MIEAMVVMEMVSSLHSAIAVYGSTMQFISKYEENL
jgi:hypothetical protein